MKYKIFIGVLGVVIVSLLLYISYTLGSIGTLKERIASNSSQNSEISATILNESSPVTSQPELYNNTTENTPITEPQNHSETTNNTGNIVKETSNNDVVIDNPYYAELLSSLGKTEFSNGVKLGGNWSIAGRPPTKSEVLNTINSEPLVNSTHNKIDMNSIIVLDDGTVISRSTGERVYVYKNPTIHELSPDETLTRDINNPNSFRGPVDYAYHKSLLDSNSNTRFVDSRIGMKDIPRYSEDSIRPGSLMGCYVIEQDQKTIFIDFNNIPMSMDNGDSVSPDSFAYIAAISGIADADSMYNRISTDQLSQFLSGDFINTFASTYDYCVSEGSIIDKYNDSGVTSVIITPEDDFTYTISATGFDGNANTTYKYKITVSISPDTGLLDEIFDG